MGEDSVKDTRPVSRRRPYAGSSVRAQVGEHKRERTVSGIYIQEAAQMVGVSATVLRMWEREGLVRPERSDAGYRLYSYEDIKRLRRIRDLVQGDGLNAAGVRRVLAEDGLKLDAAPRRSNIGSRIRQLRLRRGESLRDLALKTGLSPSYISAIERSLSNPSVASLQKLAAALGTNMVKMLGHDGGPTRDDLVVKPDRRKQLDLDVPGVVIEELATVDTQLEPLLFRIAPGAGSDESYSHEGEEFLFVLDGTFEITLEETSTYTLSRGDAMTFPSHRPHRWRNSGDAEAVLIWINTPPTF